MAALRRSLDALYLAGGVIGALFTLAILVLIVTQMVARWLGANVAGLSDYTGYCMAAASFFAFAHTLQRGVHIRVNLLLVRLGRFRRFGEIWCFAAGAVLATFLARYAVKLVMESHRWNDISQGRDATPLWIPQMAVAAGAILLAICFWDNLIRVIFTGTHGVDEGGIEGKAE